MLFHFLFLDGEERSVTLRTAGPYLEQVKRVVLSITNHRASLARKSASMKIRTNLRHDVHKSKSYKHYISQWHVDERIYLKVFNDMWIERMHFKVFSDMWIEKKLLHSFQQHVNWKEFSSQFSAICELKRIQLIVFSDLWIE